MNGQTGRLAGKVALVTGAGSGIGRASAQRLAAEGARVALMGRSKNKLDAVAKEIDGTGQEALAIAVDVSEEASVDQAVARTVEHFGIIDIAVNNAGILGQQAPVTEMPAAEFDTVVATNLRGVWLMARAEIRVMLAHGRRGSIINVSSFVAQAPNAGSSAYAASKAGVDAMMRALALEVGAQGIRVNNVAPGVIRTPMFEEARLPDEFRQALANHSALRRLGTPEDIANAVVWLASDDATFVTGQSILLDGGFSIPGLR